MRRIRARFHPGLNDALAFIHPIRARAADQEATAASARGTHAAHDQLALVQWLTLGASLVALVVSLLDFTLLIGALPMPAPGLQATGQPVAKDTATYAFEFDSDGWLTRGAATSAISNNTHVYQGQGALEFQVTGVSAKQQAFAYTTMPPAARPGAKVIAYVYAPAGAPSLLATIYILDSAYAWYSGPYLALNTANWTALAFQIPAQAHTPIRQLGIMILGTIKSPPYTGPVFLDSVDVRHL